MNLENDLKHALRRKEPDAGFASRVMARIEVDDRRSRLSGQARVPVRHWWRAAAASVTLATLLGGYGTYRVIEHRKGERAREQVLLAMRIASEKVSYAQKEVRAIGSQN